jgi:hypothetical protein
LPSLVESTPAVASVTPDDVVVEVITGAKELPEATGSADEGTEEEIVV